MAIDKNEVEYLVSTLEGAKTLQPVEQYLCKKWREKPGRFDEHDVRNIRLRLRKAKEQGRIQPE